MRINMLFVELLFFFPGEFAFLDISASKLISNQIVSSDATKSCKKLVKS